MRELLAYHDDVSGDGLTVAAESGRLWLEIQVEHRHATLVLTDASAIRRLAHTLHEEFSPPVSTPTVAHLEE